MATRSSKSFNLQIFQSFAFPMIVQLKPSISPAEKEAILQKIRSLEYKTTEVKTQKGDYLVGIGKKEFDVRQLGHMKGIVDIHRVSDDYKLVSRKWKVERTHIDLGDGVVIGNGSLSIMAGPCSIESEDQVQQIIDHLVRNNVSIMRGGVFKPRSSVFVVHRWQPLQAFGVFHR